MKKHLNPTPLVNAISAVLAITFLVWLYKFDGADSIRRWLSWPEKIITVEDDDSLLLDMLLNQDAFSNSWSWDFMGISQQNLIPATNNDFASEIAYMLLHGLYDGFEITLNQTLIKYATVTPFLFSKATIPGFDLSETQEIYVPNLKMTIERQDSKCFLRFDVIKCQVVWEYSNVVEKIELKFHSNVDKEFIDKVLNEIVEYR